MLRIKINKDISEYSEGIFLGLSVKETGSLLIMGLCEIVIVAVLSIWLPLIFSVYASLPFIACLAFCGRKIGNMSMREIISYIPQYKRLKGGIEFSSTEMPENPLIKDISADLKANRIKKENPSSRGMKGEATE